MTKEADEKVKLVKKKAPYTIKCHTWKYGSASFWITLEYLMNEHTRLDNIQILWTKIAWFLLIKLGRKVRIWQKMILSFARETRNSENFTKPMLTLQDVQIRNLTWHGT